MSYLQRFDALIPKPKSNPLLQSMERPRFRETELIASISRQSFYHFVQEFWHTVVPEKPIWNWHIKFICDELQVLMERVFRGEDRLHDEIINIPPGTSKSTVASIMALPWAWTRMPSFRFLGVSYASSLSMDLSRRSRDVVRSELYQQCFPHIQLRDDQDAKGYFMNNHGGARFSMGVDGSVMGHHAHAIGVDDPINPKEALSEAMLKSTCDFLKEQLPSRKVEKRLTVTWLIMQRLGVGDPTDLFLQRKRIRHVCLPATLQDHVSPPECKLQYVDGLLDPVRINRQVIEDAFSEMGEFAFAGQYDQLPRPREGGMFKVDRIKRGVPPTSWRTIGRYWDKAGTNDAGAYTVGLLMGIDHDGRVWILDVQRFQKDAFEREMRIKATAVQDGRGIQIGIEQEPGSGGKESAEATCKRLIGYRVWVHKVGKSDGDKAQRADPFATQVNAGNVYIPEGATWNVQAYIQELEHFGPLAKYKDQVDASSGCLYMQTRRKVLGVPASGPKRRELLAH